MMYYTQGIRKFFGLIFFLSCAQMYCYKVGLLIVATGKYITFVEPLLESAEKYFCKNHEVHYFIFTDGKLPERANRTVIFQKRLGWPYDTLMRFVMYDTHKELLQHMDYLYACDADMRFIGPIGDEILGDLVVTLSPGYIGTRGTYEVRPQSAAYIYPDEGKYYFAGGFNGGKSAEYLTMCQVITKNIQKDLTRGIMPVWHDESELNWYCRYHKKDKNSEGKEPTIILSHLYCYPECWRERHPDRWAREYPHAKLLNTNKNLEEMRK